MEIITLLSIDATYMWNLERIGFMASEEMSFENVDGQTIDTWLYYKLTYEPAFGSGKLKI